MRELQRLVSNIIVNIIKMPVVSVSVLTLPLYHIRKANLTIIVYTAFKQIPLHQTDRKHTIEQ